MTASNLLYLRKVFPVAAINLFDVGTTSRYVGAPLQRPYTMNPTTKPGTPREDGKVFWRYNPKCKGGEHWVSPEQYESWRLKARSRARERYQEAREESPEEARALHAESMRVYRARQKEAKTRQVPNPQFRESSSPYAMRSYAIGIMRTGYPPPHDTYPHHMDLIRAIQSESWWEEHQSEAYPFIP